MDGWKEVMVFCGDVDISRGTYYLLRFLSFFGMMIRGERGLGS